MKRWHRFDTDLVKWAVLADVASFKISFFSLLVVNFLFIFSVLLQKKLFEIKEKLIFNYWMDVISLKLSDKLQKFCLSFILLSKNWMFPGIICPPCCMVIFNGRCSLHMPSGLPFLVISQCCSHLTALTFYSLKLLLSKGVKFLVFLSLLSWTQEQRNTIWTSVKLGWWILNEY